ncbi:MAG: 2OG-Fe(II) oxygenase, partial [Candidatus Thiodiazotropha sp. (ex Epidulcina cf. delphinae)]|nr:2OG-Fe(II) oxygenase [Candidatus Thiodiazotropha sp. (ex Epidulcina cf. delphinae)]
MPEKITAVLKQFEAQGSFSARSTMGAEDLHIELNPIGPLKFPLKPGVVKRMIKVAKPATFGWRDQTHLDSEVRNAWKIPKSRVKIDKRRWNKTLNPVVERLKGELGLPEQRRLQVELHELLIYAPGQFFQFHQDSEKCDGMVATLVVVLPSSHSGGTLVIDHQGEKRRYQSCRAAADKLSFFAFYADCQHEVRPVTEGYRVALIYNLILKEGAEKIASPSATRTQQQLAETLKRYFASSSEEKSHERANRLVYLLDHQYTRKGLSWKALKNIDRVRVSALMAAADTLDLEIYLALADVQEIWNCEIDEPHWSYGSRRRYWDYEDEDEEDEWEEDSGDEANIELLELIDDKTTIKHWRDAAGKAVAFPEWSAYGAAICWTKAMNEFSPFESEYEGWMGNYGNTMERWYHRAAIVLWRREDRHAALLEIAPEVMIRELLQLAEKKKTQQQAQEIVRRLLPKWSGFNRLRRESSLLSPLLRFALKLDEPDLARELLYPLGADALCPKTVQAI